MTQRWVLKDADALATAVLQQECGLPAFVARTLVTRGIDTVQEAQDFLYPDLDRDSNDPACIPGLLEVADALIQALEEGKRIMVFGDFDADGITASAVMVRALRAFGAEPSLIIPIRGSEGYGLTDEVLQRVYEEDPQVLVTVDCGISAAREVKLLQEHGIQVLITDHHEPSDAVPQDVPVADPKLDKDCPSSGLAGVGVALKLIQVMGERLGQPDLWRSLVDLAAIGTVADLMPLVGENRALVAQGLRILQEQPRPGIAAVLALAGQNNDPLTAASLSFSLIPRINAAGRMDDPLVAYDLLICDDPVQASDLAARLEAVNQNRRSVENALSEEAEALAEQSFHPGQRCLVLAGEDWHEGVKGIVASRLAGRYGVPVILFAIEGDEARGSGRSAGSIDLFQAIETCSDLTIRHGGHKSAVGVTVATKDLDAFIQRLESYLESLPEECFIAAEELDAICAPEELTLEAVQTLQQLEPFGQENPQPQFILEKVYLENTRAVGATGNHLSFTATNGIGQVRGIFFRCPEVEWACAYAGPVDIIFNLRIDEWQGRQQVKLFTNGLRPSGTNGVGASPDGDVVDDRLQEEEQEFLDGLDQRVEDSLMSNLVSSYLGPDGALNRVQRGTLDLLGQGRSTLVIMPTGRGKSLIFHLHAARMKLLEDKASVFIYPLRALVSDQAVKLEQTLGSLGCVTKVLNGETPQEDRDVIFKELEEGSTDVVLTTPEFLTLHIQQFARCRRISFFVVDEAHHVGQAREDYRKAYGQLSCIREYFPQAVILACTATANDELAQSILETLGIQETLKDPESQRMDRAPRENLFVDDRRRGCRDRDLYLSSLIADGSKCIIYVNSRSETIELARTLRHTHPDMGSAICFYHAGMEQSDRRRVENLFRKGFIRTLVATSAFGEGVDIPDIRHVVLYHLPFDEVELSQMAGRAGRDGADATIHLLFNASDQDTNRRILKAGAPPRNQLATLYKVLRSHGHLTTGEEAPAGILPTDFISLQDLIKECQALDYRFRLEAQAVRAGILVFGELGLLEIRSSKDLALFSLRVKEGTGKVELEQSIRYREGCRELERFERFAEFALGADAETIQTHIRRAIVPVRVPAFVLTDPLDEQEQE